MRRNVVIRAILCLGAAALSLQAATALFQDQADKTWTPVHGSATVDAAVRHGGNASVRLEASSSGSDAEARSGDVHLTIGKTYELTGWVRTENLAAPDLDRSPIASGAALTMESMPFDVHSPSIGGNHDWARLSLRFVASRADDHILLTAGRGGTLQGKAWFEDVTIEEVSPAGNWPAPEAVRTFGPAYRYPAAGWIYLHIEGKPYDRGYQHGYLMAKEIPEYLTRCAIDLAGKADRESWDSYRTAANALFLRGFDRELLEEMRGIADGADAAGATFLGRRLDLIDIVLANTTVEMGELASAMPMTPTGIEGLRFEVPRYPTRLDSPTDHCSAFATTGPATRDGKMVIGHVTWWSQTLAEQTNGLLDIKPETGHRVLIQSYPGGIESGTDWYQIDAGVVLTETTIAQSPFNAQGTPVAFRARQAIQYGGNIDEVVKYLGTRNNGLYTNEWILGDAKNNEIAMYELGTNHTKLWRSSKNEWFGGTPGFYWGNNNAKDLAVKLEYQPDPHGAPEYIPFVPSIRDLAWQKLYREFKGKIDEQFAFLAFRTAPLVSASTMDAKVVTADMANRMMVWAAMGKPNQREWVATGRGASPLNDGLYPSGYWLFDAQQHPDAGPQPSPVGAGHGRTASDNPRKPASYESRLWKGWVLPASEADTWFVAGSAQYHRILSSDDPEKQIAATQIIYRGLKLAPANEMNRFALEQAKGVLFLDALRHKLGDDAFFKLLSDYFAANTTKTVTAQSFLAKAGVSFDFKEPADGPAYLTTDINRH